MSDSNKKILIIISIFFLLSLSIAIFIIFYKNNNNSIVSDIDNNSPSLDDSSELEGLLDSSRLIGGLPTSDGKIGVTFSGESSNELIEYISFLDFYEKIEDKFAINISDYQLPLNIKTDVLNYYDVSRKLSLDKYLANLNSDGFAIMDNPFPSNNFYNIYDELNSRQIPLFISSDFLIYYYQQTLKKVFKDVEENIFYSNLWEINHFLYDSSRQRYENNLRAKGQVNDRVLEAQRLAAAYFAVSLELLKPDISQIDQSNNIANQAMFTPYEAENYNFSLPDYLKIDVEKELELIRTVNKAAKSPVLLYQRDYQSFVVPEEYKSNVKLNNFYLSTKWLSSEFPLYYQDKNDCPDCELDFDDWRVSMITSSFIAKDIFNSYELKNKWARIYKTLAFFKGLRGDLTYVHYRDALSNIFGDDYEIEKLFADDNPESINNLKKLKSKVLEKEFLAVEGAFDRNNIKERKQIGVRMLTDWYWPNDYISKELSYPNVSTYLNEKISKNNITACSEKNNGDKIRCNGFSLDIIALINEKSLIANDYFAENSFYKGYKEALYFLKTQISKFDKIWHYNSYWKTLSLMKEYLQVNKNNQPVFARNSNWKTKDLNTAVGTWINSQLPLEKLSIYKKNQSYSMTSGEKENFDYNYIEPNLNLVNEQLSNVNMIIKMFDLLKISDELRSSKVSLEELKVNLERIKGIMVKELNSDYLNEEELQFISLLVLEFKASQETPKILKISGNNIRAVNYDISSSKLIIAITQMNGIKTFAVGPVFSYKE